MCVCIYAMCRKVHNDLVMSFASNTREDPRPSGHSVTQERSNLIALARHGVIEKGTRDAMSA